MLSRKMVKITLRQQKFLIFQATLQKIKSILKFPILIIVFKCNFNCSDTWLKFPFGPIISPSPGPTLDIAVAAPETADRKSKPVNDNNIATIKKINKYEKMKINTEFIKPSWIFCLL